MHLLKSGSKPTKLDRKRKKIEVLGTYEQYSESKKKPVPRANQAADGHASNQVNSGSSILQFMAPAPATKENAQKGKDAKMSGK